MTILASFLLAFGLFSKIPVPQRPWKDSNLRYLLAAFPLISLALAACLFAWLWLCDWFDLGAFLFASGLTLIPILVTGGIHLDGLCDTADALASHAPPEKKRQILKDPHVGAFAILATCAYLLAYVAFASELPRTPQSIWVLAVIHLLSRSGVALGVLYLPASSPQGLFATMSRAAHRLPVTVFLAGLISLSVLLLHVLCGWPGLLVVLVMAVVSAACAHVARKQFGGMSGDLSGYWLQLAELSGLVVMVFSSKGGIL